MGTTAKIAILRVMLRNWDRDFSINELSKAAGLSPSTVFKEIKDLQTVVWRDPLTGKYRVRKMRFTKTLRELFDIETETLATRKLGLIDQLSGLGAYYISGTAAIILRGLARDFTTEPDPLLIICDRKISKLRGFLTNAYPRYRVLLVEDKIRPADFTENEVWIEGRTQKTYLAVVEKAVADAIWKWKWEGKHFPYAIYCLLEVPLDLELLKRYTKERGPAVERLVRRALELSARATGRTLHVSDLRRGAVEKGYEAQVEGAVQRVLRS